VKPSGSGIESTREFLDVHSAIEARLASADQHAEGKDLIGIHPYRKRLINRRLAATLVLHTS